ncbi:hypothetical protein [Pelomonas cellulosilytica]|uniref:Uncharacterized protein n=1 Tax=Pelomonas cellulosilytica TaxID=2906762 RepID=A0ABS8Y2U2_9BURK|nr:hypothetical protein [Pelomonas sp. P8]MCE4558010.1 hypothetical protein [Pelomonas sp. P8]
MDSPEASKAAVNGAKRSAIFLAARQSLEPTPRPLSAKRSALRARKHRQATRHRHVGLIRTTDNQGACLLISADGTTAFVISQTSAALVIEKRHCPSEGPRTSHVMLFEDASAFDRWCDIEPARFDDPLLCDQLRRRGHAFFADHR